MTGATPAAPRSAKESVPSGAVIRYQTVDAMGPHSDTCGSSRSTVASTSVPWTAAGNAAIAWASARLSFGPRRGPRCGRD